MKEIFETYDVVVIGGGASGVAAAIAAVQNGAKTALVERSAYLGGKATAAYVGTICGAYLRSENQLGRFVSGGFLKQFVSELQIKSKTDLIKGKEGLQYLPYRKSAFKVLCDDLIRANKIDLFLQSTVHSASKKGSTIDNIELLNYDKNIKLQGKSFIDCSGDATLIDLLSLDLISSDQYQTSTQVFSVSDLTADNIENFKLSMMKSLQKGMRESGLTKAAKRLSIMPGASDFNQLYFKLSIPFEVTFETNRMTELNLYARSLVMEIFDFLKKGNKNFENARIVQIEDQVGIRTGRRHLGKKILNKREVLASIKDPTSIARGSWPIEYWSMDSKPKMEYFSLDDFYDIPAACLCSDSIDNLYFAGRNISADDEAIASARVIGTCLQTGFAAGILASDKVNGIEALESIKKVQNKLEF